MLEFYKSIGGRRFIDSTVPALIESIQDLTKAINGYNALEEAKYIATLTDKGKAEYMKGKGVIPMSKYNKAQQEELLKIAHEVNNAGSKSVTFPEYKG